MFWRANNVLVSLAEGRSQGGLVCHERTLVGKYHAEDGRSGSRENISPNKTTYTPLTLKPERCDVR